MKVAFITPGWAGKPGERHKTPNGVAYYRCALPAEGLNRYAPDVHAAVFSGVSSIVATGELRPIVATDEGDRPLEWDTTGWDVIVLKCLMDERLVDSIRRARAHGQIIVNDVDDHTWALPEGNPAKIEMDSTWNPTHYQAVLAASDQITVSTSFLANYLGNLGPPVTIISNALDLDQWSRQPVGDLGTIGWCGLIGWRAYDLEQVGSAVRYFLRDHPDVRFIHGGHDSAAGHIADFLNIPKSRVELRPVCPIDDYPRIWQGIDLAICPIKPTDFNRAKSDLKRLEAAAAGVPAVCTRLEPYNDWEDCTRLVSTPAEWREALEHYVSADERRAAVEAGYNHVEDRGIADRWRDWYLVYADLCGSSSRR